jgi:competence protein ComEA
VTEAALAVHEGRHAAPAPHGALDRLRVTSAHVAGTLAAGLFLVAVAGWMWWHSRPETTSLESPTGALSRTRRPPSNPDVSQSTPMRATATTPSSTGRTALVVDVEGKVRRPGIVELPAGSRVVDAIRAAGGAPRRRQLGTVNLARPLVDGEQILVGMVAPATTPQPGASTTGPDSPGVQRVDLNAATQDQLEALPQVGPVTAQAIIAWRNENGRFTSVDELLDVTGIGDKTLAQLRPYVYV